MRQNNKRFINKEGENIYNVLRGKNLNVNKDDCIRMAVFEFYNIESDTDYLDKMDEVRQSW